MKWLEIWQFSPEFIAIIGYSFARRTNGSFDDSVSLEYFENRFRGFRGDVFAIDPYPDDLQIMLCDHLKSKAVFPVRARWNVLAHAFVKSLRTHGKRAAINNMYDTLSYNYGDGVAFPIAIKDADRS